MEKGVDTYRDKNICESSDSRGEERAVSVSIIGKKLDNRYASFDDVVCRASQGSPRRSRRSNTKDHVKPSPVGDCFFMFTPTPRRRTQYAGRTSLTGGLKFESQARPSTDPPHRTCRHVTFLRMPSNAFECTVRTVNREVLTPGLNLISVPVFL